MSEISLAMTFKAGTFWTRNPFARPLSKIGAERFR